MGAPGIRSCDGRRGAAYLSGMLNPTKHLRRAAMTVCVLSLAAACGSKEEPPPAATDTEPAADGSAAAAPPATAQGSDAGAAAATDAEPAPLQDVGPPEPVVDRKDPTAVLARVVELLSEGSAEGLAEHFTAPSQGMLARVPPQELAKLFGGVQQGDPVVEGGRARVVVQQGADSRTIVLFERKAGYQIDIQKSVQWREPDTGDSDPLNTPISLEAASAEIAGEGRLWATIRTSMGDFNCVLFDKRAPKTVANFVGLARGLRAFRDPASGTWVKKPFYDGLLFHRVVPNFMIQGGDPLGNGSGGPGYGFEDELDLDLRHDRGGLLSMANSGPNTNGSQFFVTEKATPWLDDGHTIFGQCDELDLVQRIARVPSQASRPTVPIKIEAISFRRR